MIDYTVGKLFQQGSIKATIFQKPYRQGKLAVEKMLDYLLANPA